MGFILQAQRRAIESLRPHAEPLPPIVDTLRLKLEDGRILNILGVSEGIGTCSDIHGMGVLVLSEAEPDPISQAWRERLREKMKGCAYAVLLRDPTEEERLTWPHPGGRECLWCVELLRVVRVGDEAAIFSKTGHATVYPSL